jgi:hypothetical protein
VKTRRVAAHSPVNHPPRRILDTKLAGALPAGPDPGAST